MDYSVKRNQVTVCKGETCVTVVGDLAKGLAFVAIVGVGAWALSHIAKVLK